MKSEFKRVSEMLGLKACPCCGSKAYLQQVPDDHSNENAGGWYIECSSKPCGITTQLRFASGDDPRPLLAATWNRRSESPREPSRG